jgi:hypothetical protein
MDLAQVVYEIVQRSPNGLKHVDVVTEVLETGYRYEGDETLSQAVHDALHQLMRCGAISRSEVSDHSMVRMYAGRRYLYGDTANRKLAVSEEMDYAVC